MEGFGKRLKEERERLGMTQAEFAAACGVGKTAQYTYEANDRHPGALYLGAAMVAGVNVGYLLTGSRSHPGAQLYAAGKIADGVGEGLALDALGSLDLEGFEASLSDEDVEAAGRHDLAPMLRKLITHTPDLRAIFEARPAIDVGILEAVFVEIERSSLAKALSPGKKARVAALAYRLALRNGTVDREVIEEAAALTKP